MTFLVADVGGTNTRMALATADGVIDGSIRRFRNAEHDGFISVMRRYLDQETPGPIKASCVAIAGPVLGGKARLTNRDWCFSSADIGSAAGTDRVVLMNDLAALALALPARSALHLSGPAGTPASGQSLVVGVGTGFNVALTRLGAAGRQAFAAETGHMSLPLPVWRILSDALPTMDGFTTVEDFFSGRGLERFMQAATGRQISAADHIALAESGADADATRAISTYAAALGALTREFLCIYLPASGITFAGSVAAGLLTSRARQPFLDAFLDAPNPVLPAKSVNVSVITGDTEAVRGCLTRLLG